MVVAAFPIAKLGALLIRQVSKPIANVIKERAKTHPIFRTYICMPPAQFYHWCEVKTKMWVLNLGKPVNIPVLNEAMAIELGANLLGESIIFVIAAGILLAEYNRQVRKDAAKQLAEREKIERLVDTLQELYFQNERQDTQIKQLIRVVSDLDTYVERTPDAPRLNIPHVEEIKGTKPDLIPKLKAVLVDTETTEQDKKPPEGPPPEGPPPASGGALHINAAERGPDLCTGEECTCEECVCADQSQFILRRVQDIERLRRNYRHPRREGIVTNALLYLENNVLTRSV